MDLLTLTYLKHDSVPAWMFEAFLSAISDSPFPVVEIPGITGDLTAGRLAEYRSAQTKYVCTLDPDDIPDLEALQESVEFLEANPDYVGCAAQEIWLNHNGVYVKQPLLPYSLGRHYRSPLELHNGTVLKTDIVSKYLSVIEENHFYNPDWALKVTIGAHHPVKKLDRHGYIWRRRAGSHSKAKVPEGQIPHNRTVNHLIEGGYIPLQETIKRESDHDQLRVARRGLLSNTNRAHSQRRPGRRR